MGQVYRGTDTKLKRQVAIKILPPSLAVDRDRLARFQREAEVLAALNHPNIASIYGLEESGGVSALIMELVEGEDLSERIARGAIPLHEVVPIARQIADALQAAHEQGIIHRDLKPANIKMRSDGTVKVLDFGLAKAMEAGPGTTPGPLQSPTITAPAMTQTGMILGTAAYMSPEQARGRSVDRRTDVWAFGAVLYEMLTGTQAFPGDGVSEILASVLAREPDWTRFPATVSPVLATFIRRCLHKDPKQRIHDIGDMRLALEGAFDVVPPATDANQAAQVSNRLFWTAATGLTAIAVVALWVAWRATRPVAQVLRPLVRLDVDLGSDVSLGSLAGADAVISPNGTRIVYVSRNRLFTRRLDQPSATELAGTEGASAPFFSPDGQWVAFFAPGKLQKIPVDGGSAIALCDSTSPAGGSWGEDGDIIAALNLTVALSRIPATGGPPTPATEFQSGEITHRWPQILPGGRAVVFTANTGGGFDGATIEAMSLADHRRKTLVRGGTYGRYLPTGHLAYVNRGTLYVVPFDADRLEVHGVPTPILDHVGYSATNGSAQLDFAQTGTLIYRSGLEGGGLSVAAWLDRLGNAEPLLAKPGAYSNLALSPDGQRLALEIEEQSGTDIWVDDWQRDTMTRLTFTGHVNHPVWNHDGQFIVYRAVGEGLSVIRSDGSGKPEALTQSANLQVPWSMAPDGKWLAFMEQSPGTAWNLWTLPLESTSTGLRAGMPKVFLQTPADERSPSFSPDGRELAYYSNESGIFQVYVRQFPDSGGRWQVSTGGGMYPIWSRNGQNLFFETLDNHIMVAAYTIKRDSFVADKPRLWSDTQIGGGLLNFDATPDGQRIAALIPVQAAKGQKPEHDVIFLENFFDDVRRQVAAGK